MSPVMKGVKKASTSPRKTLQNGVPTSVGKATQIKKGQVLNPAGRPKGAINLSTRIQNMLNDDDFTTYINHPRDGFVEFKGAPAEAIIKTAMVKAISGDDRAREWLAKYGYGTKVEVEGDQKGELTVNIVNYANADNPSA